MPTSAHEDHYNFSGPHEGAVVRLQTNYGELNATFLEAELALTGYHEWRPSVRAQLEHPSAQVIDLNLVFDRATGLSLGSQYAYGQAFPVVTGPSFAPVSLDSEFEYDWRSNGITVDFWLPESVLWGRILRVGDAWTIATLDPRMGATSTSVAIEEGAAGAKIATITNERATATRETMYQWRITLEPGDWVVGSERELRFRSTSTPQWTPWWSFPAQVVEGGGDTIRWGGLSHTAFVGAPDATLDYSGVAALPNDPEPHPLFDIAEASAAALAMDNGEIRSFLARAPEPQLTAARVSFPSTAGGYASWALYYDEPGGHELFIGMTAAKALLGPLIPIAAVAKSAPNESPPIAGTDISHLSSATPGAYARLAEAFAAEENQLLQGLSWRLENVSEPYVELGTSLAPPQNRPFASCVHEIRADGATGIVMSTYTNSYGYSVPDRCENYVNAVSPLE